MKCSTTKKITCAAMKEYADSQYGSGRRIFLTETYNPKTNKQGMGAAYAYGRKDKEFIWLNFCPWCGGKWSLK